MAVAFRDYYEVLGVPRDASAEDIRRAYRKLARAVPPRRQQGPGRRGPLQGDLRGLRGAARPREARALRPPRRATGRRARTSPAPSGFEGFGGAASGGFGDVRVEFGEFGGGDFSDFFEGLFGGRRGAAARGRLRRVRGLLDARRRPGGRARALARGGRARRQAPDLARRRPRLRGQHPAGRARRPAHPAGRRGRRAARAAARPATCSCACASSRTRASASRAATSTSTCRSRRGRRRSAPRSRCRRSTGRRAVKVPPGSSTGRKLRLRGQGMPGPRGGHGDLYAVVKIEVPKKLDRRGARAVRAARRGVEVRSARGAVMATTRSRSQRGAGRRRRRRRARSRSRCSPARPACTPSSCGASCGSACSSRRRHAQRRCSRATRAARLARAARLRRDLGLELRRRRAGVRAAGPHRRTGGAAAPLRAPDQPLEVTAWIRTS